MTGAERRRLTRWNTYGWKPNEGVGVVTLVDVERRNAMTAQMVDEIVATSTRSRPTARPPRSSSPANRPRSARAPTCRASAHWHAPSTDEERRSVTSIYEGFLRVLRSPLPTIAAVNGAAVGAGMNLAARVRRAPRRGVGALRHAVREDRAPPRRRSHLDARARGRAAGRGRDGVVRRDGRRRPRGRDRARVVVPSRRRAARRGAHARGARPRARPSDCSTWSRRRCAKRRGNPTSRPRSRPRCHARRGRSARAGSKHRLRLSD